MSGLNLLDNITHMLGQRNAVRAAGSDLARRAGPLLRAELERKVNTRAATPSQTPPVTSSEALGATQARPATTPQVSSADLPQGYSRRSDKVSIDYLRQEDSSVQHLDTSNSPVTTSPDRTNAAGFQSQELQQQQHITYHGGTRSDYQEFSNDYLKTGEGNMVRGAGQYQADLPGTAYHYLDQNVRMRVVARDDNPDSFFNWVKNIRTGSDSTLDTNLLGVDYFPARSAIVRTLVSNFGSLETPKDVKQFINSIADRSATDRVVTRIAESVQSDLTRAHRDLNDSSDALSFFSKPTRLGPLNYLERNGLNVVELVNKNPYNTNAVMDEILQFADNALAEGNTNVADLAESIANNDRYMLNISKIGHGVSQSSVTLLEDLKKFAESAGKDVDKYRTQLDHVTSYKGYDGIQNALESIVKGYTETHGDPLKGLALARSTDPALYVSDIKANPKEDYLVQEDLLSEQPPKVEAILKPLFDPSAWRSTVRDLDGRYFIKYLERTFNDASRAYEKGYTLEDVKRLAKDARSKFHKDSLLPFFSERGYELAMSSIKDIVSNGKKSKFDVGSQVFAMYLLDDAGLVGSKYLEASSRNGGREYYNYVVFNDSVIHPLAVQPHTMRDLTGKIRISPEAVPPPTQEYQHVPRSERKKRK